jgi:hypothetical protein
MGKVNKVAAAASMVAGMGGYGCRSYDVSSEIEFAPHVIGRHIVAIQAFTDTEIKSVDAAWDAPADISDITLPGGNCLYIKASKITITSGTGVLYYGIGDV